MTAVQPQTPTPFWASIPSGHGRRRIYFPDGLALRGFLYDVARRDPDGAALAAVRLPAGIDGSAALEQWRRRVVATARTDSGLAVADVAAQSEPAALAPWRKILIGFGLFFGLIFLLDAARARGGRS